MRPPPFPPAKTKMRRIRLRTPQVTIRAPRHFVRNKEYIHGDCLVHTAFTNADRSSSYWMALISELAGILHLLVAMNERTHCSGRDRALSGMETRSGDGRRAAFWCTPSRAPIPAEFSGFYMPLMMVLWLSCSEGSLHSVSVAPGKHAVAQLLGRIVLAIVYSDGDRSGCGARQRNWGRSPGCNRLLQRAAFHELLRPGPHPGVLDWYTVLVGVFTLCVLGAHRALYLLLKTTGPVPIARIDWQASYGPPQSL